MHQHRTTQIWWTVAPVTLWFRRVWEVMACISHGRFVWKLSASAVNLLFFCVRRQWEIWVLTNAWWLVSDHGLALMEHTDSVCLFCLSFRKKTNTSTWVFEPDRLTADCSLYMQNQSSSWERGNQTEKTKHPLVSRLATSSRMSSANFFSPRDIGNEAQKVLPSISRRIFVRTYERYPFFREIREISYFYRMSISNVHQPTCCDDLWDFDHNIQPTTSSSCNISFLCFDKASWKCPCRPL